MSKDNLQKYTLYLRDGDAEFLRDRFPKLGAGGAVRRIIANFVDDIKAQVPLTLPTPESENE